MNQEEKDTPSTEWFVKGEPDPHGMQYVGKRRRHMALGQLTDDQLAHGVFMNYNAPLDIRGIIARTNHSPIAWVSAAKDRIRWLSRMFEKSEGEKAELQARLAEKTAEVTELHAKIKLLAHFAETTAEAAALHAEIKSLHEKI